MFYLSAWLNWKNFQAPAALARRDIVFSLTTVECTTMVSFSRDATTWSPDHRGRSEHWDASSHATTSHRDIRDVTGTTLYCPPFQLPPLHLIFFTVYTISPTPRFCQHNLSTSILTACCHNESEAIFIFFSFTLASNTSFFAFFFYSHAS